VRRAPGRRCAHRWDSKCPRPTTRQGQTEFDALDSSSRHRARNRCLRLDRLRVADVQAWLNRLAAQCQCCAQGKDVRQALHGTARCCAIGECCHRVASPRTIKDVRTVLRSALHSAVSQELIDRNVAQLVQIPKRRKRGPVPWTSEAARRSLEIRPLLR
jgi:hypothetical protein